MPTALSENILKKRVFLAKKKAYLPYAFARMNKNLDFNAETREVAFPKGQD